MKGGVEALSQVVKTTSFPWQRPHSRTSLTPRIWHGGVTLPGARRGGGSPRHVSGERESSLADPHGGPAATDPCIGLKYPCDYGTDIYIPICTGINGETSYASKGLFASPAS